MRYLLFLLLFGAALSAAAQDTTQSPALAKLRAHRAALGQSIDSLKNLSNAATAGFYSQDELLQSLNAMKQSRQDNAGKQLTQSQLDSLDLRIKSLQTLKNAESIRQNTLFRELDSCVHVANILDKKISRAAGKTSPPPASH